MDSDQIPVPALRDDAAVGYAAADPAEETHGAPVRRLVSALLRYKWLMLLVIIAGSVVAVMMYRLAPREYQAEARLWIQAPDARSLSQGPLQSEGLVEDRGWMDLLRSWEVLDYVVRDQRLYLEHDPRDSDVMDSLQLDTMFRAGSFVLKVGAQRRGMELRTRDGVLVEQIGVGDSVGRKLGFLWAPAAQRLLANREIAFTVRPPRDAAKILNSKLIVDLPPRQGTFMTIEYTGGDPARTASVVNAVAYRFIDVAAQLKKHKLTVLTEILRNQLASADSGLREASIALEDYKVETITLPSDAGTAVQPGLASTQQLALTNYFKLKTDRELLEKDRQAVLRAIGSGRDTLSVDALATIPSVQLATELSDALQALAEKRAELRALRHQYEDAHRLVREADDQVRQLERQTIPALAQRLAGELQSRVGAFDEQIAAAGVELAEIPPRATNEAGLRRQVATAEVLYNTLLQRYEEARLAAETTVPDVSVLDEAKEPHAPTADNRVRLLIMILAASFGLALVVPIALDRMDPRLRYPEQVTGGLRLPILGAVPMLSRGGVMRRENGPQVVESLRTIRLAVMHAHGAAGPLMVTVSSPGSGDGKTFVTSNLALGFADLGLRTLLIDGDIRRGQIHRLLDVPGKPGLTDFLAGEAELEAAIRPTRRPLVDVLPRGTLFAHGPELLSSHRMGILVAAIRQRYQAIVVDSPPLGAGIDPLVLASLTGNLLLVLRTGRTERALAEAKLTEIDRLPIRVLGAVLNGIETSGPYKYYSYLPEYGSRNEEEAEELQPA